MNNLTLHIADMIKEFIIENDVRHIIDHQKVKELSEAIITEVHEWDKEAWEERNAR